MSLPWYKRNPAKFQQATIGWNEGLKGAYSTVLDLIYMNGGELPDENGYISVHIGCTKNKWTGVYKKELLKREKITLEDGIIRNSYATNELLETDQNSKPSQNLAKTSTKPREKPPPVFSPNPHKTGDIVPLDKEGDKDKDYIPSGEGIAREEKEPEKPKPKTKRKTSWPSENWRPKPLSQHMKDKLQLTQEEYSDEFEQFKIKSYARNYQYADWDKAWLGWLTGQYSLWKRKQSNAQPKSNSIEAAHQARRDTWGPILEKRERERLARENNQ